MELESKIQIYSPGAQLKYRKRFCKTSPLNVQHLVDNSEIAIPANFDWVGAYKEREKLSQAITSIKVEELDSYVGSIAFNSKHKDAFVLAKGEYIVEVNLRIGALLDRIQFFTNQGRTYGPFGGTGGCFRQYKGQCLINATIVSERWKLIFRVCKDFTPIWYKDPLYKFITKNKVERIHIVYSDVINFVRFDFSNGETRWGGEDAEILNSGEMIGGDLDENYESEGNIFDLEEDTILPVLNGFASQESSSISSNANWTQEFYASPVVSKEKKKKILVFPKNEFVNAVQTRKGSSCLQTLIIHTNLRSYGPFGNNIGGSSENLLEGNNLQDITLTSVRLFSPEKECVQLIYYPKWEENILLKKSIIS